MSTRTIDKIKKGLGIILTVALIASVAGVGFGSRRMEAPDIEQANLPTFDGSTYRRPAPNVTIDATDVIRVGASGTTTMGPGNSIKKATQSGIPEITAGSFQSQALAGETAYWPTITFASDKAVNITGVTLSGTGVSASVTHTGGNLNNTQSATWQIQGGTATAGNLLKADIKYTYTWNNTYTGASVTDEYVTTAYSYVENIIFPAGGWVWAAAGSNANNAADTNYISRIIGRGVYGGLQQLSSSSGDYRSGYIDLAHSDQFVVVTDANFTRSTLRIDPPRQGAGDRELANGTSAYTSGDQHRGKAIIYRDSGLSSLKDNNVRMHFLIHKDIRAGVDLTWETVHLRSGDATYKGSTGNDLGTSHAGSWTALAPTGPKDGTVSSGGTWGGFKTTGMQITSYFEGSGAAGTYTLINQWTGKGKSEGTPSATNWIQHYLAQLIEVITYNKNNLRSKLNTQIGITNKTVTGAKNVTTIVTTNGSDPTSGGISNTNKGKNPQAWYYSAGWSTWKSTYETGWLQMQKPNTSQASIDSAVNAMDSPYAGLTLARANYSNSTNQNLGSGQGNTYYGSSVKPIDTTLSAINNADTNFNAKLKFWKTGTYNYYTASSKSALEAAIADAQAVQAANYNVLYQPYVDLAAKELHDAINNLAYAEYNLTYNANFSGGPTQSVLVEAGSTINLPATAPFSRTGYTFNNWNTAANASGTSYTSGAQFTMGGVDTSLYAQWTPHTYKVTYDGNGSDGGTAMAQSSHTYDVSKALSKNTYTRTGYAFMGWATSTNGSVAYQDEQSVSNLTATNNGNVTLYAVWVAQQYEVQYLGNGSDGGSMTNSFHTVGVSKKLSKNNYTRTGYNFNGWNDAADGTGTHYNDEETVVNLALVGNVTVPLYAQWEIKSYTISWLANGGTGGGANQAEHGSTPTPISAGTRTGYTFTEWSPEIIPATGPASYTAQWQANTYYVAFDANTGTGSMTNQEFTYNAAQNLKANAFSKTGYTFAGWATSAGGDVVYTAGQNVNNLATSQGAVVTLYAKWSPNSYTVQYDANSGTGTTGSSSHIYDTPSGLTENGFSKVGHSFIGWSTDSGATSPTYTDGQSVNNLTSNPGGIVNFYAVWQINQYKVYFDKNEAIGTGATGSHGPLTQNYDSDVTLPTTGFSAPGRTLLGWHTNSSATSALESYKVPAADSTLYAVWSADYSALDDVLDIATGNLLPASPTKDPGYLPNGDEYDMAGFSNDGYYSRNDFESAGLNVLENAVAGVNRGLDHSKQDDVNDYKLAIENALNNLVLLSADYSNFDDNIAIAEAIDPDHYTESSYDALAYALQDAYEYDGSQYKKPLQFIIDGASDALQNAIDGLELREADYTEVNDVWDSKPDLNNYSTDSVTALEEYYYNNIVWDLKVDEQSTVDGYADALRDLIDALVPKLADYSGVIAALKAIPDNDGGSQDVDEIYLKEIYTTDSVNALTAVVNAIDWEKNMNEQAMVDAYATNIQQKTAALVAKPADYSGLLSVLNRSAAYSEDHYTTETYMPYNNLITQGWVLYNAQNLTTLDQHIINTMVADINNAYNALELKTVGYTVKYQAADNTSLAADKTGSGKIGSEITEYSVSVEGYTADQNSINKTLKLDESENVLIFTYTINEYTISFDSKGGSDVDDIEEDYGTEVQAPTAPTLTGYTFQGWYEDEELETAVSWPYTIGASDVTFYAKWSINEYTISFDSDGGSDVADITQDYGTTVTPPTAPTKEGYTFRGWDPALPETMPAEDLELTAQWEINQYTVSFDSKGGTAVADIEEDYGTEISAPTAPTKEGHTFDGWYADEAYQTAVTWPYTLGASDVTFYAKWNINQYTLTFKVDGETYDTITQDYATTVTPPADPTKTGYTFGGWDATVPATMPAEDLTFNAQWSINEYTISFDSDGGSEVEDISQDYGTAITPPAAPTKEGYTFRGWDPALPETMPAEDLELTAQWEINQYTVSFDSKGGTAVADIEEDYGTEISAPTAPTKEGHTFDVWYADEAYQTAVTWPYTLGASDVTFYAKWNINQYTLTFKVDGEVYETITQDYGTAVTAPADPEKEGYDFQGWSSEVPSTMPAENQEFTAKWSINEYTITFDSDGGSPVASISLDYGEAITAPDDPTKEGYTFQGWDPALPETMPAGDLELTAQWQINQYTVSFDSKGGSAVADITEDYGTQINKPTAPTREGYAFDGWYADESLETAVSWPYTLGASDVTFYAKWNINEYTLTFKVDGENYAVITQDYGTAITPPSDPTKTGYTFGGWDATVPTTMPAEDLSFNAQWNVNVYDITFVLNNGDDNVVVPTDHGETPVAPTGFTRTGYTFDGWDPELAAATEDVTYTAQWAINVYDITFVLDNGEADVIVPTDHGEVPTAPTGFTKTGYTFGGWDAEIVAATSAVTYTAQWGAYFVQIAFDANGGTGGQEASPMQPGTTLTVPAVKRDGYVLTGWIPALTAVVPEEDTTYVAQWQKTETGLTLVDGEFVVNISGWADNYQYQIWTYQVVTSDDLLNVDENVQANQWILSQAYTLGSEGALQADGSINFTIDYFTSPTHNYVVAVRVIDEAGNFVQEIRDAYTPEDVGEPVITKVIIDGAVTTGYELREITGVATNIKVIGNDVEGLIYSAQVTAGQSSTSIDVDPNVDNEFNWTLSEDLEPGIYIVEVKAEANGNKATYEIKYELYKTDDQTEYGYIDNLNFEYDNGSLDFDMLFGTANDRNDYGNGSFSYRVREPGRSAFYRSVEFTGNDTVTSYGISKPGIYEVSGYVTRVGYIGTEANGAYDDGIIRNFTIPRPGVSSKDIKLTLEADHDLPDIPKGTAVTFTAISEGLDEVQYSFWRYDASGYILLKDWSTSNELKWTPARVGSYTLQVRAKGAGAGSYEIAKSIEVNVIDTSESKANITNITLNAAELQANVKPRTPIMVKANATATNGDDLLYKFYVYDKDLRTRQLKGYSVDQHCVWKPRKPGVYTISVLVKNQVSFGKYDAIESFEITVS